MSAVERQFLVFLGKRIREKREAKNMTQEDMGKVLGIHRTYVGMVERGEKNVSVMSLRRIAQALGVSLSQLIDF